MFLIFIGGGAGSLARYGVIQAMNHQLIASKFPMGLLAVNLLGSLAIGLVAGHLLREGNSSIIQPLIIIGFLGGFTTFSSFSLENADLLRSEAPLQAVMNIAVSVVGGIILATIGFALTSRT